MAIFFLTPTSRYLIGPTCHFTPIHDSGSKGFFWSPEEIKNLIDAFFKQNNRPESTGGQGQVILTYKWVKILLKPSTSHSKSLHCTNVQDDKSTKSFLSTRKDKTSNHFTISQPPYFIKTNGQDQGKSKSIQKTPRDPGERLLGARDSSRTTCIQKVTTIMLPNINKKKKQQSDKVRLT